MSSYEIEVREEDGVVHLALTGELDLTNAHELELDLNDTAPAAPRVVVDLNGVSFLDSAALHVLFKLARRRGADRVAFVADPDALIAGTLAIVGLAKVAPVAPSIDVLGVPAEGE